MTPDELTGVPTSEVNPAQLVFDRCGHRHAGEPFPHHLDHQTHLPQRVGRSPRSALSMAALSRFSVAAPLVAGTEQADGG
jgi:hypothetical protein